MTDWPDNWQVLRLSNNMTAQCLVHGAERIDRMARKLFQNIQ